METRSELYKPAAQKNDPSFLYFSDEPHGRFKKSAGEDNPPARQLIWFEGGVDGQSGLPSDSGELMVKELLDLSLVKDD